MRFENPYFLLLLIFPILFFIAKYFLKKFSSFSAVLKFSSLNLLGKEGNIFVKNYNLIQDFLICGSIVFFIIALAKPLGSSAVKNDELLGLDIIICLDVSGSMLCYDGFPSNLPTREVMGYKVFYDVKRTLFAKNRLNSAKNVIIDYIDKQEFNRIGLVVFAGYSYTLSPLTYDKRMLKKIVEKIEFDPKNDGTAIGMGIATSINRIKDSKTKSKIIILLTDGNNNAGLIEPITAATIATNYGIRIYTIGLSNNEGFLQPANMNLTEYLFVAGEGLDEKTLKEIADITGGKFFRAYDPDALKDIYNEIDGLEKSRIEIKRRILYKENYFPFLVAGFVFMLFYILTYGLNIKVP